MKSKLLILPFLAIFSIAMGIVVGSTFSDQAWISYSLWGLGLALLASWGVMDSRNLRRAFKSQGARHGMSSGLTVILGCLVIVGIGFLASRARFNKQFDVTRDSLNTLSDQTVKIVQKVSEDKTFKIMTFFDDDTKKQKFTQTLDLYLGVGLKAEVQHIDPKAEPMKAVAENVTTVDTVIIKMGENDTRLTDFSEEKMTNALMKVLKTNIKKVYFTKGHGERVLSNQEAEGYQLIKDELVSERYQVEEVNLLELGSIPSDASAIVLAGPQYDFHPQEVAMLESFLSGGKPVLFMLDAMTDLPVLNGLMNTYGLKVDDNILILRPDDPRAQLLGQNNSLVTEFDEFSPVTKDFANRGGVTLVIPNARSVSESTNNPKGMKTSLVAKTADIIIAVDGVKKAQDLEDIGADRIVGGPFSLVGLATGRVGGDELAENKSKSEAKDINGDSPQTAKELRIALIGSSEIVTNLGVQRGENVDMFLNVVNYLMQDEDFISIRPKDLTKSTLDVSSAGSQLLLLFFAYIYPTMFLGGGVVYWMRRRRA